MASQKIKGALAKDATKRSSAIPIIDISPFLQLDNLSSSSNIKDDKSAVIDEIRQACEETGFFAIINHGVPESVIDPAWDATTEFFDLPMEEKMSVSSNDAEYPYGYENSETLTLGKAKGRNEITEGLCRNDTEESNIPPPPDLKETFSIGPREPQKSGMPARRFPIRPSRMKEVYEKYYEAMEVLAKILLRSFALALDLEEDWFEDKVDRHMCALRALNYPDLDGVEPLPGQLRAGAHTDYGPLTILKSGGPGLQVVRDGDNNDWVDVPYLPNAFIINLGDLMQRWTNDKWVSTLHRVIIPPKIGKNNRRQSIAFFVNTNGDTKVYPIHTCIDESHPAKYEMITAKEYLMSKHLASMRVDLDDQKTY